MSGRPTTASPRLAVRTRRSALRLVSGARDDDGDSIREVHDNPVEGIWTGLRNYLRMFRGVTKVSLAQYLAIFLWSYNIKTVTDEFLRALLGVRDTTDRRT
jgi:transposase